MPAYVVDTNIWLRQVQPTALQHQAAVDALSLLLLQEHDVYLTAQNLIEFWSVASRPASANGLGWSVEVVRTEIERLQALFPLLDDTAAVFQQWSVLVVNHRVIGRRVHDARLVASMLVHDITHLLTFNHEDFRAFPITVVTPAQLLGTQP